MKHGEFKTPGGKLVQIDFELLNDLLTNVQVSGDFFLYPEDALEPITHVIEGSPATLAIAERAALIEQAISPGVEWLGSSPLALATAIERALTTNE